MRNVSLLVLLLLLLLLFSVSVFAQDKTINADFVQEKSAYFIKDTWTPFSGIVEIEDEQTILFSRITNGFAKYVEVYDRGKKLRYKQIVCEFDTRYDSVNKNPKLKLGPDIKNIADVTIAPVLISYSKNGIKRFVSHADRQPCS